MLHTREGRLASKISCEITKTLLAHGIEKLTLEISREIEHKIFVELRRDAESRLEEPVD